MTAKSSQATPGEAPAAERVLVIDDSATVLHVVEAVLQQAGYEVHCLSGGAEVVPTARGFRPDLVVVDLAMPQVNGFDVCRALGEHADLQDIPIIVMSTRGDPVGQRFVRAMGVVDHIAKPFAPQALLAIVEHTLRKTRDGDATEARRAHEPDRVDSAGWSTAEQVLADLLTTAAEGAVGAERLLPRLRSALRDEGLVRRLQAALRELPGSPALAGDLERVPLAEVLQLLSLQRQSGFLHLTRGDASISIAFKDGAVRLVTGEGIPQDLLLGNILIQERLLQLEDLEVLLANRHGTRRLLGAQLVKLGYMSREDLHRALRRQSAEIVYEVLRWGGGLFEFERRAELPPEVLEFEFDLSIDELLMEGFRRVDEWGLIEAALVSFELVPMHVPGALEALGSEGLNDEEHEVLRAVDGRRTVQQIIECVGYGTFQAAHVLYRLVSARVISVHPPAGP